MIGYLFLFVAIFYGIAYCFFETLFNAIARILKLYDVLKPELKLTGFYGYVSLYMFFLGAIIGIGLFGLSLIPIFRTWQLLPVFMLISGIHITLHELLAGYIFNILLKLNIWNYSNEFLNFKGQISFFRSIGRICLGFIIWLINNGILILFWGI